MKLLTSYPAYEDGTDSVPKRRHTTIRSRGNTQKNTYNKSVSLEARGVQTEEVKVPRLSDNGPGWW